MNAYFNTQLQNLDIQLQTLMGQLQSIQRTTDELFRIATQSEGPTLDAIAAVVCKEFRLTYTKLTKKSREPHFVMARAIFTHICRHFGFTWVEIANYLKKNHATIIWIVKDLENRVEQYPEFKNEAHAALAAFGLKI